MIMKLTSSDKLYLAMMEGVVYRRQELAAFSNAVDRDLKDLLKQGLLRKAASGLYYRARMSRFGALPPDSHELVRAFLQTNDFLLTSRNVYNALGLGLTQLTNELVVYNRKRAGSFLLNGLVYHFARPINFPKRTTEEFLVVDLLNNYNALVDPPDGLWSALQRKLQELPRRRIDKSAQAYGKAQTLKLIKNLTANEPQVISP
jgi:hypothetical protein